MKKQTWEILTINSILLGLAYYFISIGDNSNKAIGIGLIIFVVSVYSILLFKYINGDDLEREYANRNRS